MAKTAKRRHDAERMLKRRVRKGHSAARMRFEGWRNIVSRTPCRCSCYYCRSYRIEVTTAKQRRTDDSSTNRLCKWDV